MLRNIIGRRLSAGLLALLFAFFLTEAVVTGCCDADNSRAVASASDEPGQPPADNLPGPATQVCHCAHTTSVFRSVSPQIATLLVLHISTFAAAPPLAPGRTLKPDLRPPVV